MALTTEAWHHLPVPEVLSRLGTSADGLTEQEAADRLSRHGRNLFRAGRPVSGWAVLASQLRSVLVILLVAAGLAAALSGDLPDVLAIGGVLVLNVAIGFGTEIRAHRAMEALRGLEVHHARVLREGRSRVVDAAELVPGDVILLEAGQGIPADARLVGAVELQAIEAPLTGEPGAVVKQAAAELPGLTGIAERSNMVYKSTTVATGSGRAVIVATGMETEVGRIGQMTEAVTKGRTPMELRLDALGRRLALAAVGVAALIAAVGALQGVPWLQLVQSSIALAVAAVPEGLPAVATIAMAAGVRRMARRHALIRHLPVVETLGSASVICTDKTGTLTEGRMAATVIRTAEHEIAIPRAGDASNRQFFMDGDPIDPAGMPLLALALRIGALANTSELGDDRGMARPIGDPTDAAFLAVAHQAGVDRHQLLAAWPAAGQVPFSSERMLMATFHEGRAGLTAFVKGSPRAVLDRCDRIAVGDGERPLGSAERSALWSMNQELAGRGLRVLALATSTVDRAHEDVLDGLTWVAFAGLSDPPAEGVAEAIHAFREAGIRTVMLTGDQQQTAVAVARELGMLDAGGAVLDGADVEGMDDASLQAVVPRVAVYGRTSPRAKLRIVTALQRQGEVVAMLGDGVNDAAALRKADIGVAMGRRGTDLAKDAADVILEDDRFPTIAVAVREGRVILDNVRKFVSYLFSCNLAEILVLLVAGLAGHPAILAPLQILWLNLLTDTFPALALAVEPPEPGVMRRRPLDPHARILPPARYPALLGFAGLIALATLAAFVWGLRTGAETGSTMAFMTLAIAQVLHLGNARSGAPVLAWRRAMANRVALGAAGLAVGLQLATAFWAPLRDALHVVPLQPADWLVVAVLASLPAAMGQFAKQLRLTRRG